MNHTDPRTTEIIERNRRTLLDATATPPPHIADNPHAYLKWLQQPAGTRPTIRRPLPRPGRQHTATPANPRTSRPPEYQTRNPETSDTEKLETERRRQLNALEKLIAAERQHHQ